MNILIAQTIAAQIGSRAFYMMGTHNKLANANELGGPSEVNGVSYRVAHLIFDVRGSPFKVNKVTVTLAPNDTYTLEFWKWPQSARAMMTQKPVKVSSVENIYAEQLHTAIETHTGLALSL